MFVFLRRLLLLCVVALGMVLAPVDVTAQDQDGLAHDVFDFPAEHVLQYGSEIQGENFTGWLYFTGILTDEATGETYGYQFTLFEALSRRMGNILFYNTHAAINDINRSQHPFLNYLPLLNDQASSDIGSGEDPDLGPFWYYEDPQLSLRYYQAMDAWHIVTAGATYEGAHGEQIALDLMVVNDKLDYYLQRPDGKIRMGACEAQDPETMAGMSYYYSHPAMTTTGTIQIDGREISVIGDSWFDHQWGNFGNCHIGWDWFSFRMDDGSYIMLFNFKDAEDNDLIDQRALTYIAPDGSVQWWYGPEAGAITPTRWWTSDLFNIGIPIEWIIETPVGTYAMEPYFDEQTMMSPQTVNYWEGLMRVRAGSHAGEQVGMAFMELANYDNRRMSEE